MTHAALIVLVCAAVTALIRFLPFLIFPEGKEPPAVIARLTRLLSPAVIGMLVVYCLSGIRPLEYPHGIPELLSCAAVALLHAWKRNTLLSILTGTVLYMFLVQVIFA